MSEVYYKDKTIHLLKSFCTIVECENNMTNAANKLHISSSAISLQIKSLEHFLQYTLFDRGNKMSLTEYGKKYYPIAKDAIYRFNLAFNTQTLPKVNLSEWVFFKKNVKIKFNSCIRFLNRLHYKNTTFRLKYIILFFVIFSCYFYNRIDTSNYFFDKQLYKFASPKIQTIINDGSYTISENVKCSFEVVQTNLDMYNMVISLSNKYKNLPVIMYSFMDSPIISMRLTGNNIIDNIFKKEEYTHCNVIKSFNAAQEHYRDSKKLFELNKNFRIYNLYTNDIEKCTNCKYFIENTKKYPNNLFGIKADKDTTLEPSRGWIIKYGDYYYLLEMKNLVSTEIKNIKNSDAKQRRYLNWKKMTAGQLKNYNHGAYWKMIIDYNILFN